MSENDPSSDPDFSRGKFRLACASCDRNDFDFVAVLPEDWHGIQLIQSLSDSLKEAGSDCDGILQWYTHLGTCPRCQ
jgi:hypothetical protein